ncbi:hypothetical protein PCANC_01978 [Puccinia coronata f. sp. avenae]|uniref:Uncharacterized protein n=1 Tax=Puccinia coronata f. sp. avenae TaxID=200324 RepID=A0A2N5W1U1_9BASI|nr:hypothetical protein PCANC_01978 [Puccinia coronata f. sp. avenae]
MLLKQRELFVKRNRQAASAKVLAIQLVPQKHPAPPPLTYQPTSDPPAKEDLSLAAENVMGDYCYFDKEYDDYKEPSSLAVNVLGLEGAMVLANILVNTGGMANFVSEEFIHQHDLKLCQHKNPIHCVGFNGREGVGGLVTQDWVGVIQLLSIKSKLVPLSSSFGVTRLGSIDAIFGLPWLD